MKDAPPNYFSRSNLSRRVNNPQIYNQTMTPPNENEIGINIVDPEAQSKFPDLNYVKELTGRVPASMSFIKKSTRTLIREVIHDFDQFTYILFLVLSSLHNTHYHYPYHY
eukprot:344664_1